MKTFFLKDTAEFFTFYLQNRHLHIDKWILSEKGQWSSFNNIRDFSFLQEIQIKKQSLYHNLSRKTQTSLNLCSNK